MERLSPVERILKNRDKPLLGLPEPQFTALVDAINMITAHTDYWLKRRLTGQVNKDINGGANK